MSPKIAIKFTFVLISTFILLNAFLKISKDIGNADELALGKATTSVYANFDDIKIHCEGYSNSSECINSANESSYPKVLWIGNSQLHAINQFKEGDIPAPAILHNLLKEENKFLSTFSFPNANLTEKYFLFKYLIYSMDVETLILPIVMDDLREGEIRNDIKNIRNNKDFMNTLDLSDLSTFQLLNKNSENEDLDGVKNTFQQKSEFFLNQIFSEYMEIWERRPEMRAALFINLYKLRNTIFNISPSSERKMVPAFYKTNLFFLKKTLNDATKNKINVILYIAPIRNDVKIPYNQDEYASLKNEVINLAKELDITYLNLENAVPNEFWGSKDSTNNSDKDELDFMHFQHPGHIIFSDAIQNEFIFGHN
ncbi:MAG: hypothetical protein P8J72_00195 [SAR86 cluster bacterium]|nr:hypothetical protein [SAR86 cluster bacterium]